MNVAGSDEKLGRKGVGQGVQIVDLDTVLFHYTNGGLVVLVIIAHLAPRLALRHRGGMGPDQLGLGLLQAGGQLIQVLLVLLKGSSHRSALLVATSLHLGLRMPVAEVPHPPVEMDDVPFRFTDPSVQHLQTRAGVLGVALVVPNLDLALQDGHDVRGVANRYGVPDEQGLGQILGPQGRSQGKKKEGTYRSIFHEAG